MSEKIEVIEFDFSEAENTLDLGIAFLIEKNVKPICIAHLLQICCEENYFNNEGLPHIIKNRKTLKELIKAFKNACELEVLADKDEATNEDVLAAIEKVKKAFVKEVVDFTHLFRVNVVYENYLEALLIASIVRSNIDIYPPKYVILFLNYCKKNDIFL